jgi:predicted nucleic acid-binding protein
MRVVLDAGPLIHLSWIDRLDLLKELFGEVSLPPAVRNEVLAPPPGTLGLDRIRAALAEGWLVVREVEAGRRPEPVQAAGLGAGESDAILLADEIGANLLITDDATARKVAGRRNLRVTGTMGVLRTAREAGLIGAVLPLLLELRRLGQWVSDELVEQIRREESGSNQSRRHK